MHTNVIILLAPMGKIIHLSHGYRSLQGQFPEEEKILSQSRD